MRSPANHRATRSLPRLLAGLLSVVLVTGAVAFADTRPAAAATSGWLQTKGAQTVTASGAAYTVKSVSWFGMETTECAPHGLWQISLESGIAQIASWGFNTIRLPFSNECLTKTKTSSINGAVNPKLVSLTPLKLMDAVIAAAKKRGLNVILDRHRPSSAGQSELWYTSEYSEKRWIDDWKMLATRYKSDSTVIGFDLHNEPRGTACWGCGDAKRDWPAAATRAGNAIHTVNPKLLIVVEGVEREEDGSSTWWGGGLRGVKTKPVTLKVANRVVYSPHDYPSTVYPQKWFSAPDYPKNLESVWEKNWGYIQTGKIAPVLLGEFGTKFETTSDKQWLHTLVSYLKKKSMGFSYWSFNPNSGDTGGLVKDDWVTPQQAKLDALAPILGKPVSSPSPTPSTTATRTPTHTPRPTATPTRPPHDVSGTNAAGVSATWNLQSAWGEGYVADLAINGGSKNAASWSVSWKSPSATSIVSSWGMSCSVASDTITCVGSDYAADVAPGEQLSVGLQVAAKTGPRSPAISITSTVAP